MMREVRSIGDFRWNQDYFRRGYMEIIGLIVSWLRIHAKEAGAKGYVCGLSGGVDSAVVSRLCQLAFPETSVAVIMPCHSNPQDFEDATLVATAFHLHAESIDLSDTFDEFLGRAASSLAADQDNAFEGLPKANVKARLRMTALFLVANAKNLLVAGTGNRSEIEIGYYTKYGDGGVDVLPIGGLLKREVRELAKELGVPARVIEKAPSAGLWLGQTDESEMGFTYDQLETYLSNGDVPEDVALRIRQMNDRSAHKRCMPPVAPGI